MGIFIELGGGPYKCWSGQSILVNNSLGLVCWFFKRLKRQEERGKWRVKDKEKEEKKVTMTVENWMWGKRLVRVSISSLFCFLLSGMVFGFS